MPLPLTFPPLIDTTGEVPEEWKNVRLALKQLIEKVAPNASVYEYFELEFDPKTLQKKVTPRLKGKQGSADEKVYHAWMLGITEGPIIGSEEGGEFIGGYAFTWKLSIDIEGYFDTSALNDPYQIAENEMQQLTMIIFRNQDMILEKCKFYSLGWNTLDLESFADGNNLVFASGNLKVDVQVSITI